MSRSGYIDDDDDYLALGRWRCRVASATRGKRGQAFFRELLEALDAMPEKLLITDELVCVDDEESPGMTSVCALGALGQKRGIDMANLDPEDSERVAATFGIAEVLAREVVYMNDEWGLSDETPEARWTRMRKWVEKQVVSKNQ